MRATNPFKKGRPKKVSAEDALSSVFDDPKVGEMMRRMTTTDNKLTTSQPFGISEAISEEISKYEKEGNKQELKELYLRFVTKFGFGKLDPKRWLEDRIHIDSSGVTLNAGLIFREGDDPKFPPKFNALGGSLDLSRTLISKLDALPRHIEYHLYLVNCQNITSLEDLPVEIGGNLYLSDLSVSSIPAGLSIGGKVYTSEDNTALRQSIQVVGYTLG